VRGANSARHIVASVLRLERITQIRQADYGND
jgi:hypothetical protein